MPLAYWLGGLFGVASWLFLSRCDPSDSILWFCGENQETVFFALTFASDIVRSLAWPATVLVVVIMLRKPFLEAFSELKLSKIRVGAVEAEFLTDFDEAERDLRELGPAVEDARPSDKVLDFLKVDKRYAVLAAWNELEGKLKRLAEYSANGDYRRSINFGRKGSFSTFYRSLDLPKQMIGVIDELRRVRNEIAHNNDILISESDILRYIGVAADIERFVQNKLDKMPY